MNRAGFLGKKIIFKKRNSRHKSEARFRQTAGQSLLELLVGIGILSLTIGSAIVVVFGNQSVFLDKKMAAKASALAVEGLEATKTIAERSWDELAVGQHGLLFTNRQWAFSGTQDTVENFTRIIEVTEPETNVREIKSTINWQTDPQRPQKIEQIMRLTNWRGLFGDWSNPQTLGSVDLGPGNQGTDLKVRNKIVYMSAKASSAAKPDLYIVDATNGAVPFIVSSLHTGPGLNALDVSGNYIYAANSSDLSQLHIISIADINNPTLLSAYDLPSINDQGLSVFVLGNYAYVGTDDDAIGKEFHIVDVSNPSNPISIGSLEVGKDVNTIYVQDNYAYLAIDDAVELWVVDVSNPTAPSKVTQYDAPGSVGDGKAINIVSNKLYLGRLIDTGTNNHELNVLDISNPLSIINLGSKNFSSSINDAYIKDYLAFTATNDSNSEFQIYNISNPSNITLISSFNFPQVAAAIDYENNIVYVAVRSNDALRIITSQ